MKTAAFFLVSCWLAIPWLYAAEQETANATESSGEVRQAPEAPDPQTESPEEGELAGDDGLTRPEDEDFVPSVRITEDLPVAFPVDI